MDRVAGAVANGDLQLIRPVGGVEVDDIHPETERPGSAIRIPVGVEVELAEMKRRAREEDDVAPDPEQGHVGVPAHVVEDRVRRELGQGDGEGVPRRAEVRRDVDVERGGATAMRAGQNAVDVNLGPPV